MEADVRHDPRSAAVDPGPSPVRRGAVGLALGVVVGLLALAGTRRSGVR